MARLTLRLTLESGARIGPGRVMLLEGIHRTGSISAAAREMGMSYRRAWLLVDRLNQACSRPVVSTHYGGRHGGGAALTDFGRRLVDEFEAMQMEAREQLAHRIEALERDTES